MKRNTKGRDGRPSGADVKPSYGKAKMISVTAVMLAALIFSLLMFARSYGNLDEVLQLERMDYVEEISMQIINGFHFMENEYREVLLNYAGAFNTHAYQTLAEARAHFLGKDNAELLLANPAGDAIDLDGNAARLTDASLLQSLTEQTPVAHRFSALGGRTSAWLFAAPLNAVQLDGAQYSALLMAIPPAQFQDHLAISLFDHQGASYIVDHQGAVLVQPPQTEIRLNGSNFFAAMRAAGAAPADVDALEKAIAGQEEGSVLLPIQGADWLIRYSALDEQSNIVVAVPLTVTAARTYDSLSQSILYAAVSILTISISALMLLMIFFQRDRQRSRSAMAAEARSNFFSKLSHDIRTPLNAIIGLQALARESQDPDAMRDYLNQSTAAADYLLGLINDVLDMRRIDSGKLTLAKMPFDLNDLIAQVEGIVMALAAKKQLSFSLRLDRPFDSGYLGDPMRIKQALLNLLSNAVKFTKPGGRVALSVAHGKNNAGAETVILQISDTGIGMSEEYLSRIFTPFEQEQTAYAGQTAGSGLGLSIAHHLITLMQGVLEVKSKVNAGTTFTVTLPLPRCELPPAASAPAAPEPPLPGGRILLAEDNAVNQQITTAVLRKKFGLDSDIAPDGKQAVERFAASAPGFYDLILMDVRMPVLGGLEATRQIRALDHPDARRIPIIAFSANAYEEDVALSLAAGMNGHLSKPLNLDALSAVLHAFLKRKDSIA